MHRKALLRAFMACGILVVIYILFFALHGAWVLHDTPLIRAVGENDEAEVLRLLRHGADINEHSRLLSRWTPLICAVYGNDTNMVHLLIESGANINLPDAEGKTPLIWAAEKGDLGVPIVKELLAHGADLDSKDKHGFTVFNYADSEPPSPQLLAALEKARRKRKMGR